MNKLITSLACGTVLSMSIMGASYANPIGSAALGGIPNANTGMDGTVNNTRMMNTEGNLMNGTTGTMNQHESIMKDKIRTGKIIDLTPITTMKITPGITTTEIR